MGYRMIGTAHFEFEYETDDLDPKEAIHVVESLPLDVLLEYSTGAMMVQVEKQVTT